MNAQNTDGEVAQQWVRPLPPFRQPEAPAIESMVAKHRELMDALGDLPHRTMVAVRDAARQTQTTPQWDRVEAALYALIGDPE